MTSLSKNQWLPRDQERYPQARRQSLEYQQLPTYTHTNTHTHIQTHIHTYKHTYIHTYKHTLAQPVSARTQCVIYNTCNVNGIIRLSVYFKQKSTKWGLLIPCTPSLWRLRQRHVYRGTFLPLLMPFMAPMNMFIRQHGGKTERIYTTDSNAVHIQNTNTLGLSVNVRFKLCWYKEKSTVCHPENCR